MQAAAANALLKTLEEPSLDTTLILLTDSPQELLPTIFSRCMHLSFQPIAQDLIEMHLQTQHQLSPASAKKAALLSNGSLAKALSSLQQDDVLRLLNEGLDGKMPTWQAVEALEAQLSDLEGLELHQQVDRLLAAYLVMAREKGGDVLQEAIKRAMKAKSALQSNVRLSACLDFLLQKV